MIKIADLTWGDVQTVADDEIYHADLVTRADLDIIAKAGMPLAPVLTSPWIGVEHGGAGRGLGDRVRDRLRAQLDTSFQMLRNARDRGISVMSAIWDDFLKVDAANLQFRRSDGSMSPVIRRLSLERGDAGLQRSFLSAYAG